MGLAERRATKAIQDNQLPGFLTEIQRLAGTSVPVPVPVPVESNREQVLEKGL